MRLRIAPSAYLMDVGRGDLTRRESRVREIFAGKEGEGRTPCDEGCESECGSAVHGE
jgi:hypothetical protein